MADTKKEAIKRNLENKFEIRYNSITGKLEYKRLGEDSFSEVNREILKEFKNELKDNGIDIKDKEIYQAFGAVFKIEAAAKTEEDEAVEMYIEHRMDFRYNSIKLRPEYRIYGEKDQSWKVLNKYQINTLVREIKRYGYKVSRDYITALFESEFNPMVNPIKQYFEELEFNPQGSTIADLAATVQTKSDRWRLYLTKWLVATCANAFENERNTNHTMLILCGAQGCFKTTWIENLMPQEIKRYMYSGKIDFGDNKQTLGALAENLIINMDDQMKDLALKKGSEEIKNLITCNYVTYRRPYDISNSDYPRLASFIGSINGTDFLNDPTGSRRYLPFEVEAIDIKAAQSLDMNNIWAEVYQLYVNNFRYYFTKEEVAVITAENEAFTIITPIEEELLLKFRPAEPESQYSCFLITSQIAEQLQSDRFRDINHRQLGDALKKHGFVKQRKRINGDKAVNGYWVRYNEAIERIKEYPELRENLTQKELRDLQIEITPF